MMSDQLFLDKICRHIPLQIGHAQFILGATLLAPPAVVIAAFCANTGSPA
jgi:hypothetical protein